MNEIADDPTNPADSQPPATEAESKETTKKGIAHLAVIEQLKDFSPTQLREILAALPPELIAAHATHKVDACYSCGCTELEELPTYARENGAPKLDKKGKRIKRTDQVRLKCTRCHRSFIKTL